MSFLQNKNQNILVYEDDEPKAEELRYTNILDISYSTIYFDRICRYCAAINCKVGDFKVIYYTHLILTIIQVISPSLLLSSTILWKEDSVTSFILNIIFSVSHGWHSKSDDDFPRRLITIICVGVLLISIFIFEFLIFRYQRRKVVSPLESNIVLYIYKYLLPHFLPLLLCGFPASIHCLANHQRNFLNYANTILPPLILIYEMMIVHFMSERIIIENHPSFTLNSKWLPTIFLVFSLNTAIECSLIEPETEPFRIFLLVIMMIFYLHLGIMHSILLPHLSHVFSYFISALCLSCSCIVLLNLIFIECNFQIDILSFVFLIVLCFLFYIMNTIITNKSLIRYTQIFDEMADNSDADYDFFDASFTSRTQFTRSIHICFPIWHPYIFSWRPFQLAIEKWPDDQEILLLWMKLLVIFPHEFELFKEISTQFQQNPNYSLVYRLQLRYIVHSNTSELIPSLRAFLTSFEQSTEYLKQMHQYFFENVLSKKALLFWPNVSEISEHISKHYGAINELLDEFPNNIDIVRTYCTFLDTFKINPKESNSWKIKLQRLYSGQKIKPNVAYTAALKAYPELADMCAESEEIGAITELEDTKLDLADEDQLQFVLKDMISHSKIGYFIPALILSFIGTIIVLILFSFLNKSYKNGIIDRYLNIVMTESDLNDMILSFSRFGCFSSYAIVILQEFFNITEEMDYIAPTLYSIFDVIPPWTFDVNDVIEIGNRSISSIYHLNQDLPLFQSNLVNSFNLSFANNMINITESMIKVLKESPESLLIENENYNELISFFLTQFESLYIIAKDLKSILVDSLHDSMSTVNNFMVGTILVAIILVTTPFVICYFSFGLISDAITKAFSSLPSTSIREAIDSFNDQNSSSNQPKYNSRQLSRLDRRYFTLWKLALIIPSVLSFLFIIIGCYVIYFSALTLSDEGDNYIKVLEDVTHPISSIYVVTLFYTQFYNAKFIFSESSSAYFEKGIEYINITNQLLQNGIWGNGSTYSILLDKKPRQTHFELPRDYHLTDLEKILCIDFLFSLDLLIAMHQDSYQAFDSLWIWEPRFIQLAYYFTFYAMNYREDLYINSLENQIVQFFNDKESIILPIYIVIFIMQILIWFLLFFVLYSKKKLIHNSLKFFMFIKPEMILQNRSITSLITQCDVQNNEKPIFAFNSKQVLLKIPESIVLLDKNFVIYDYNDSFSELISMPDVHDMNISEVMLYSNKTDYNIDHLEMKLVDMINGNDEPFFQLSFSFLTPESKLLNVLANVVCLDDHAPILKQSEYKEIKTIVVILHDLTENMIYKDQIQFEQDRINSLLKKSMPEEIIGIIEKGSDPVSFNVQSLTYGGIMISTDPFLPDDGAMAPFLFFNSVFAIFDSYLENYKLLSKIRKNMLVYLFAGGIFEGKNSPENQAEEAVRFAISLLDIQHQLEQKLQRRISLKIGINNGGPAIFGSLSTNRPHFHVIGDVVDMAQELILSSPPGKVHISQSVHELIYTHHFNIQECDETISRNGKGVKTYLVAP